MFMIGNKSNYIFIFILILLVTSLTIFYLSFGNENIDLIDYNQIKEINNIYNSSISPLTNQGIIIEINRIRNREFMNTIKNSIVKWKIKPAYYYTIEIDGENYLKNKKLNYLSGIGDNIITEWDTFFQEKRIIKDVEEEQETSNILIQIIEQKRGFEHLSSSNLIKEEIKLTYNYRTGRWIGDDNLYDNDGYGHYKGNKYEIWFNVYQTDFDADKIPFWTEVNILKTNPQQDDSNLDPDCDGIPTSTEWYWGYNPLCSDDHKNLDPDIDGLQNIEEYQMRKFFANPFQQDIFIEIDLMENRYIKSQSTCFYEEVKQIIIERFSQHNINVYIDDGWRDIGSISTGGDNVPYVKCISWDAGTILQFYNNFFSDESKGIFRYVLICHEANPFAFSGNTIFNRYDTIVIGQKYLKFLPQKLNRLIFSNILMHELGHTLGIAPYTIEGCDNISFINNLFEYKKTWGKYRSVMNYFYIFDPSLLDYSNGDSSNYDQNDWDKFYLPFFEIENNIVIDPGIKPPAKDKVINEEVRPCINGWEFEENLTNEFEPSLYFENLFYDYDLCEWLIYKKNISESAEHTLKIFVKPILPINGWSLIAEGYYINNRIIIDKNINNFI
jgi:hypothetical protein